MNSGQAPWPLTICGLGPGADNSLTQQTLDAISESEVVYLRTSRHPNVHLLSGYETFDFLYEQAETFEEVYLAIVEQLADAVRESDHVTYVVPGSPLILERTVRYLRADSRFSIEALPALSFLDVVWARLLVDPIESGVRLIDGHRFGEQAQGSRGAMLIAHTHSNMVLSDIKLSMDVGPQQKALLLQAIGTDDELVVEVDWPDLDRTIEADHLTTVYVPELLGEIVPYRSEPRSGFGRRRNR